MDSLKAIEQHVEKLQGLSLFLCWIGMEETGGGHCLSPHFEFDSYTNIHYFEKFIFVTKVYEQTKFPTVFLNQSE